MSLIRPSFVRNGCRTHKYQPPVPIVLRRVVYLPNRVVQRFETALLNPLVTVLVVVRNVLKHLIHARSVLNFLGTRGVPGTEVTDKRASQFGKGRKGCAGRLEQLESEESERKHKWLGLESATEQGGQERCKKNESPEGLGTVKQTPEREWQQGNKNNSRL